MSKEMSVMLVGVVVIVVPYLGVPASWRTLLLVLAGLALIGIGFLLRSQGIARGGASSQHRSFVENVPAQAGGTAVTEVNPHYEHKEGITSLN